MITESTKKEEQKSLQRTKEQERAARAWKYVSDVKDKDKSFEGKYSGWVKKLPALVLTNGLGQTLAYLQAKGKGKDNTAPQVLYNQLSEWIMQEVAKTKGSLLEWLMAKDSAIYRHATTESLAFINWLKRFSEATLKSEEPGFAEEEE